MRFVAEFVRFRGTSIKSGVVTTKNIFAGFFFYKCIFLLWQVAKHEVDRKVHKDTLYPGVTVWCLTFA